VLVIENHEAQGLSGARNSGIAVAQGDLIAFMDEDASADPTWLESLYGAYDDPSVMGVGGMISPLWLVGQPSWFPDEFNWVVGCTYRGVSDYPAQVRNLIGCNMSLRRDIFLSIGPFRSEIGRIGALPYGCEETELCIRANQRFPDRKFIYLPYARVTHRVPAQRGQFQYFRARCYAEGLSKALVTRLVGGSDGLSSERTYTFQTLPAGIVRGIWDAIRHHDLSGLGRAGAIIAGLAFTTLGYLAGKISMLKFGDQSTNKTAKQNDDLAT
jgi:cellulose synthase/poly-beta-1,6-N-acetylglucosamine synthase-like glycosyltransferase